MSIHIKSSMFKYVDDGVIKNVVTKATIAMY